MKRIRLDFGRLVLNKPPFLIHKVAVMHLFTSKICSLKRTKLNFSILWSNARSRRNTRVPLRAGQVHSWSRRMLWKYVVKVETQCTLTLTSKQYFSCRHQADNRLLNFKFLRHTLSKFILRINSRTFLNCDIIRFVHNLSVVWFVWILKMQCFEFDLFLPIFTNTQTWIKIKWDIKLNINSKSLILVTIFPYKHR